MGNIAYRQQQYAQAAKLYRMALDQLPPTLRRLRLNAQRSVGLALARMGRWQVCGGGEGGVRASASSGLFVCFRVGVGGCGCVCGREEGGECTQASASAWLFGRPGPPRPAPCTLRAAAQEAADAFGAVMGEGADHQTGFNRLLCGVALGDAELARAAFVQLVQVGVQLVD